MLDEGTTRVAVWVFTHCSGSMLLHTHAYPQSRSLLWHSIRSLVVVVVRRRHYAGDGGGARV